MPRTTTDEQKMHGRTTIWQLIWQLTPCTVPCIEYIRPIFLKWTAEVI